jgi:hypothetical protein
MKVLDLRCANGHGFEGWFGSEDDFLSQNGRSLIECPLCADRVITRLPSAPRLNLSNAKASGTAAGANPGSGSGSSASGAEGPGSAVPAVPAQPQAADGQAELQALWIRAVRQALANTEDVGERFAEEARRIHYGESDVRGIRGVASAEEREALHDEGIEVMSLPMPAALKGPIQ